jgi:alanine dehydrogenase
MAKIIEEEEVQRLIRRDEAIGIIENVYRAAAEGGAAVSHPSAMHLRGGEGSGTVFKLKGAVLDALGVAGFRIIGDVAPETGRNSAYVYLVDAISGVFLGLVSELWLHRVRTAITGLVSCRALLPSSPKGLVLVGTGRIAEEFVRCAPLVFPDLPITVVSREAERAYSAVARWQRLTTSQLAAASNIRTAVAQAPVVVTLSDATERLFAATDLQPGALVCAMGGQHEFDRDVLDAASVFVVDEIDFVCTAGNAAHWIKSGQATRETIESKVDATVGEILLGRKSVRSNGITLAIVQGMAICDLALAKAALDRAGG